VKAVCRRSCVAGDGCSGSGAAFVVGGLAPGADEVGHVGSLLALAGYSRGQRGGAEVVELFGLVQVAGVALGLGQHRDDLVGSLAGVLVGAASLAPCVYEGGLAACACHEGAVLWGAVLWRELERGQLVLGYLAARVGGLCE